MVMVPSAPPRGCTETNTMKQNSTSKEQSRKQSHRKKHQNSLLSARTYDPRSSGQGALARVGALRVLQASSFCRLQRQRFHYPCGQFRNTFKHDSSFSLTRQIKSKSRSRAVCPKQVDIRVLLKILCSSNSKSRYIR